jgi:outer membrane protein, heavy metal efflux system
MVLSRAALPGLFLILLSSACSTTYDASWPDQRPLGTDMESYRPERVPEKEELELKSPGDGPLTLNQALALALLHNPELRAFAWEMRAREAGVLQSGLLPNPEISGEVENFGGSRDLSGYGVAEITVGLTQLVELGGDRRKRTRVAEFERDLAGWDYETVRLDVFTETEKAFVGVLAAQHRLSVADSLLIIAGSFYDSVSERVDAGKVSALERQRAQVVLSRATIDKQRAQNEVQATRILLVTMWGQSSASFTEVVGRFEGIESVPAFDSISLAVERNPDVARWNAEMALLRARVESERAAAIPDPTVSFGARRLREIGETGLVASISIPLQIFDRNQGAVKEAEYRERVGDSFRDAAIARARATLRSSYEALSATEVEVRLLREEVLPSARANFSATNEGYNAGKFDLINVLDAQRTLFESTGQYINALQALIGHRADVERLIGTPLSSFSN